MLSGRIKRIGGGLRLEMYCFLLRQMFGNIRFETKDYYPEQIQTELWNYDMICINFLGCEYMDTKQ